MFFTVFLAHVYRGVLILEEGTVSLKGHSHRIQLQSTIFFFFFKENKKQGKTKTIVMSAYFSKQKLACLVLPQSFSDWLWNIKLRRTANLKQYPKNVSAINTKYR